MPLETKRLLGMAGCTLSMSTTAAGAEAAARVVSRACDCCAESAA